MAWQQKCYNGDMKTDKTHPGISIKEAPFSSLLLQVVRAHALLATELFQQIGIVPPQEVVLLYLDEHGPCPQREIVRFMGRDRSTVTNTLQAMERAGLIERTPSPTDRRAMVVGLTEEGRRRIPGARAAWHRLEEVTTRGLTDAQRSALLRALTVVRDELDRALAEDLAEDPDGGPGGRHP